MAKYKTLSTLELKELEKEFIDFLVINGITADDWLNLKNTDIEKANAIIDQFSDVVFEATMRKINFLEFVTSKSIKCFQCLENEIILVGIDVLNGSDADLSIDGWEKELNQLSCYTKSKPYLKVREIELFNMIESGASVSDGGLFKQLCLLL